jgi:hypothetical protein
MFDAFCFSFSFEAQQQTQDPDTTIDHFWIIYRLCQKKIYYYKIKNLQGFRVFDCQVWT